MAPKDLDRLIKRYLDGKCSEQEKYMVDSWYASLGKNIRGELLDEQYTTAVEERLLSNLHQYVDDHTELGDQVRTKTRTVLGWRVTAIAASLLLFSTIAYYFLSSPELTSQPAANDSSEYVSVENAEDHPIRMMLPDGSLVALSAASKIRFPKNNDLSTRELFLEGEAYFDVAHDSNRPFYVYAGDVVTKVLGTSFNVNAFDKSSKVTVTVKTGKVTVYSRNAAHKKVVLTPNQEAVYNKKTEAVATHTMPQAKLSEFKHQLSEMRFDESPVSEVLITISKHYNIEIEFNEETLRDCVLTSSFMEEGFYDRMDVICTAIGATYKVVDSKVTIESSGCTNTKKPENEVNP